MKTSLLLLAMTLISLFLFAIGLHAQQEVDASWYNPWPDANKAAAHSAQAQRAKQTSQPKMVSSVSKPQAVRTTTDSAASKARQSRAKLRTVSSKQMETAGSE